MFYFLEWDSPYTLVLEVAISVVIFVAIFWFVRQVNARSAPPPGNRKERETHSTAASVDKVTGPTEDQHS